MSARRSAFAFFTLQLGRYFFGQKFPRKWFGRGDLILLSLFSLVRTPLDFLFWGSKGGGGDVRSFHTEPPPSYKQYKYTV